MDTWRDVGHLLNLRLSWSKRGKLGQKKPIFVGLIERVREERKNRAKSFFPRSTEFRRSKFIRPRTKVHLIDEGYAWVPKTRDFDEDPNEELGKLKFSSLGSVHEAS